MTLEKLLHQLEIGLQILYLTATELDIIIAKFVPDRLLMFSRQRLHRGLEIYANDLALSAYYLRHDVAGLATAGAEVQHGISRFHEPRRISAAIIFLQDLCRNDL